MIGSLVIVAAGAVVVAVVVGVVLVSVRQV